MNLPLQMSAVSRGRFQKSRIVSSAGRVHPSWGFFCTHVACSCANGTVACCDSANQCSCDNVTGNAACAGFGGHGHHAGNPHTGGAAGECGTISSFIDCYDDQGNAGPCN
jgi:hypothetical protein